MRKKKKYILIRKIASFFFVLVIGVVFTLQGFCAGSTSINLTKYYTKSLKAWKGTSTWSVSNAPSITSNRYYQGIWPSGNAFNAFGLTLALNNSNVNLVSVNPSYTYDICFDIVFVDSSSLSKVSTVDVTFGELDSYSLTNFTTNSSGYRVYSFNENFLGSEINAMLKSFGIVVVFSSDFTYTNVSIQNLRVVEHTPNEDVISYFDQPVTPPANQGGTDTTISDYQQKEDQLTSNAAGVVSDLPGMISALDMSDFAGGFNLFNDLFTDFWSRSGKLKMIALFAIVSGSVMVILGLGVRGSRRLDPDKPPKEVIHKHYLAGKSKDNSSNKGSD